MAKSPDPKKEGAAAPARAPEMQEAWSKFEAGDNRAARAAARQVLANASASAAAKGEAEELLQRIGYDPGALLSVGVVALVIVGILLALWLGHKFD